MSQQQLNKLQQYGEAYQLEVIALLFHKPALLKTVGDMIRPEYLSSRTAQVIYKILDDLRKQFPTDIPTKTTVVEEFKKLFAAQTVKPEELPVFTKAFEVLFTPPKNAGHIEAEIREFAATKAMEFAVCEGIDGLKKGDLKALPAAVNKAMQLTQASESKIKVSSFWADRKDFLKRLQDPQDLGGRKGISTGFKKLDDSLLFSGVDLKEMMVVLGAPGRGKSTALQNMAVLGAMLNGHDALYYSLEMATDVIYQRLHAIDRNPGR